MSTDLRSGSAGSLTSLLKGIVDDVQALLAQQLALFKHEVESDLDRTREAGTTLLLGLAVATVGAGLVCLMLVHLLEWATELPLWACHGIVGGTLVLTGIVLFQVGKRRFRSFNPRV
jgi:hypothetical protein